MEQAAVTRIPPATSPVRPTWGRRHGARGGPMPRGDPCPGGPIFSTRRPLMFMEKAPEEVGETAKSGRPLCPALCPEHSPRTQGHGAGRPPPWHGPAAAARGESRR